MAVQVHRLDKDASGVLLVARSPAAASALTQLFRDKTANALQGSSTVNEAAARALCIRSSCLALVRGPAYLQ